MSQSAESILMEFLESLEDGYIIVNADGITAATVDKLLRDGYMVTAAYPDRIRKDLGDSE